MKSTWILAAAAGAAGLLCAGALLFDSPGRASGARAAGLNAEPAEEDQSRAELAALRRGLDELVLRVERLERDAAQAAAPVVVPTAERVSAPALSAAEVERLRGLLATLGPSPEEGGAPLADLVTGLIEERDLREREARAEARRSAAAERIERRVAELATELGLSSFQSAEMQSILTDEELGREAFFDDLRDTGAFDRDLMRARMKDLRDTTLAAAHGLLTPEQYDGYVASRPDGFLAGRSSPVDGGGAGR